jgi:sensor histidine kinase YesM
MEKYPFIFSDSRKYKISRHVAFWFFWWVSQGFLYAFAPINNSLGYGVRLLISLVESFIYLIPHIFLSYSLLYFVIPRFLLRQKYWETAAWVILLFLGTGLISGTLSMTVIYYLRAGIQGTEKSNTDRSLMMSIFLSLLAGLRGGISIAGIAAAIKLMKYWVLKERRNLQLQKENIASQLQVLKAQVHPHFLFNTLNNIYSHTQKVTPVGSALVMGLSDLLRYILHEGSRPFVPLSKELRMIEDYILLEKVRYGERLEINKHLPEDTKNLVIAPLLLLPFVENCFKHGVSQLLDQAWIRISVQLDDHIMRLTLMNAKLPEQTRSTNHNESGIGIANVRKRLDLIYPNKYELSITSDDDVFIVNLRIELERGSQMTEETEIINELIHA